MDLQLVIALNLMAASAVACVFALAYRPAGYAGWVLVNGLVIVAGALALQFAPQWVGWVTAGLFVPLVGLPALLSNLAQRAEQRGRHDLAARLAKVSGVLHPGSDSAFNAALGAALRGATPAETEAALQALRATASPAQQAVVDVFLASERDDWPAVLLAARASTAPPFELKASEIRALGELGRRDEMLALYEQVKSRLIGIHLTTTQLFIFAFTGRVARVEDLLTGALSGLPVDGKVFWRAIARRAANPDDALAQSALAAMAQSGTRYKSRLAAARALARPAPPALSPASQHIVDAADARLQRDATRRGKPLMALYATLAVMAVNIAMLLWAEWRGGSENLDVLYALGAMWPPAIGDKGEVWRLAAAAFLHLGPVHLLVNLFMLMVFGRLVESQLGAWRTLGIYLWCGVGSMALVYALMRADVIETNLLVGASGAIFGLFGVIAALDTAAWLRSRDRLDLNRLSSVVLILALQAVVDFTIPNVSFAAHATGFALGLIAGAAVAVVSRSPTGATA